VNPVFPKHWLEKLFGLLLQQARRLTLTLMTQFPPVSSGPSGISV
jgi:hypothetical protein